jgi:hypothetical protein
MGKPLREIHLTDAPRATHDVVDRPERAPREKRAGHDDRAEDSQ